MPLIRKGIPGIRRAPCIVLAISSAAPPPLPSPFFSFSSTRVARDKRKKKEKNRRLLSALWAGCCVLAQSLLFPLVRRAERGDRQPERVPLRPVPLPLRVSRWRRRRASPIAGGGRDVGGPGCLPAAEVPRQLCPGAQQGGAEDQRLER